MGLPLRTCSSPSSSMIAVPDAVRLPSTPWPMARVKGSITSGGKPLG